MTNKKEFKNLTEGKNDSTDTSSPSKNFNEDICHTSLELSQAKKIRRVNIYSKIQESGEISKYDLAKDLKIDYRIISDIIRDFLFAGLVEVREIVKNGRDIKLIRIPQKKERKE
jgi:hypothetical protein